MCECAKRAGGWRFFRRRKSVRFDHVVYSYTKSFLKRTSDDLLDTLDTVETAFPNGLVKLEMMWARM